MTKRERNAVLAGLRFVQANYSSMPYEIRDIFTDGIPRTEGLTRSDIDALCESINVADYNRDHFEVSRVHAWEAEDMPKGTDFVRCNEGGCSNEHLFSVYVRNPQKDGRSEWLSDHVSQGCAIAAAKAYEWDFDEIVANQ